MDFLLRANNELLLHTADRIARGEGMLRSLAQSYASPAESRFWLSRRALPALLQEWSKGIFLMDILFIPTPKDVERCGALTVPQE